MADEEYRQFFRCNSCGKIGAIIFLKLSNDVMIIKQRCPIHGVKSFRANLSYKDKVILFIRDAVFQCYECGEKSTLSSITIKKPWTLIQCSCPTHGIGKVQKIWSILYSEITSKEIIESELVKLQPIPKPKRKPNPLEKMKFCPYCGMSVEAMAVICNTCGAEVE